MGMLCITLSLEPCFAVSQVLHIHGEQLGSRREVLKAFRSLELAKLRRRARALARNDQEAMTNATAALSIKIADELLELAEL